MKRPIDPSDPTHFVVKLCDFSHGLHDALVPSRLQGHSGNFYALPFRPPELLFARGVKWGQEESPRTPAPEVNVDFLKCDLWAMGQVIFRIHLASPFMDVNSFDMASRLVSIMGITPQGAKQASWVLPECFVKGKKCILDPALAEWRTRFLASLDMVALFSVKGAYDSAQKYFCQG
mgnify:CR=1 FL=1